MFNRRKLKNRQKKNRQKADFYTALFEPTQIQLTLRFFLPPGPSLQQFV